MHVVDVVVYTDVEIIYTVGSVSVDKDVGLSGRFDKIVICHVLKDIKICQKILIVCNILYRMLCIYSLIKTPQLEINDYIILQLKNAL